MTPFAERRTDGPLARSALVANAVGLGMLTAGVAVQLPTAGPRQAAAAGLLAACVTGWIGWLAGRRGRPSIAARAAGPGEEFGGGSHDRGGTLLALSSMALMSAAGGALAVFVPLALVFSGVAALGATQAWSVRATGPLLLLAPFGVVAAAASGAGAWIELANVAGAVVAGAIIGATRRQTQLTLAAATQAEVSEARADAERARAELLEGRNHLARELHDVLAHTLSALSLHLEALDALVAAGPARAAEVRVELDQTRRLVREGVAEARGAVRALRDDLGPLEDQLARLVSERAGTVEIRGERRDLPPDVTLALYRVAQEALTNATKHARSPAAVLVEFGEREVVLTVTNPLRPTVPPRGDGDGDGEGDGRYGLQGIRERVLLVGGRVETGPEGDTWRVRAEVPA